MKRAKKKKKNMYEGINGFESPYSTSSVTLEVLDKSEEIDGNRGCAILEEDLGRSSGSVGRSAEKQTRHREEKKLTSKSLKSQSWTVSTLLKIAGHWDMTALGETDSRCRLRCKRML